MPHHSPPHSDPLLPLLNLGSYLKLLGKLLKILPPRLYCKPLKSESVFLKFFIAKVEILQLREMVRTSAAASSLLPSAATTHLPSSSLLLLSLSEVSSLSSTPGPVAAAVPDGVSASLGASSWHRGGFLSVFKLDGGGGDGGG